MYTGMLSAAYCSVMHSRITSMPATIISVVAICLVHSSDMYVNILN